MGITFLYISPDFEMPYNFNMVYLTARAALRLKVEMQMLHTQIKWYKLVLIGCHFSVKPCVSFKKIRLDLERYITDIYVII